MSKRDQGTRDALIVAGVWIVFVIVLVIGIVYNG